MVSGDSELAMTLNYQGQNCAEHFQPDTRAQLY